MATAQAFDDGMRARIDKHKQERSKAFITCEEPIYLAQALRAMQPFPDFIIVDCLNLWLNNLLFHFSEDDEKIKEQIRDFIEGIKNVKSNIIMITNEVGSGVIPDNPLSRKFVDQLGFLNQEIAALSDEVIVMTVGIPQWIKSKRISHGKM